MGDRIVFLGTGGDVIVMGKQYRATGGIIIQCDDTQLHIDPGPGSLVMSKIYEMNLRENTAVLVSHNHVLHAGDANAVISAMTYNGLDKRGVLIANKTALLGSPEDSPFISDFFKKCVEKVMQVEVGSKVGIKDIDIECTPTKHIDPLGVGFKIMTPKYSIGYTSDTGYSDAITAAFAGVDILILAVPFPGNVKDENNLNSEDAVNFIKKVRPKLAVVTHFGIKMLQADPLYEARLIQRNSGVEVLSAKDGMVVSPLSFSTTVKQKSLKNY